MRSGRRRFWNFHAPHITTKPTRCTPDRGLDLAAIPRSPTRRPSVSIRDSRPGQHLLPRTGQRGRGHGRASVANTGPVAESEFRMRTLRRDIAPRMSGLPHSIQRASSQARSAVVDNAFQPRQTAHEYWTCDTGSVTTTATREPSSASDSVRLQGSQHCDSRRPPPRVLAREGGGMSAGSTFLRSTAELSGKRRTSLPARCLLTG